jgi:hypothetical protein
VVPKHLDAQILTEAAAPYLSDRNPAEAMRVATRHKLPSTGVRGCYDRRVLSAFRDGRLETK